MGVGASSSQQPATELSAAPPKSHFHRSDLRQRHFHCADLHCCNCTTLRCALVSGRNAVPYSAALHGPGGNPCRPGEGKEWDCCPTPSWLQNDNLFTHMHERATRTGRCHSPWDVWVSGGFSHPLPPNPTTRSPIHRPLLRRRRAHGVGYAVAYAASYAICQGWCRPSPSDEELTRRAFEPQSQSAFAPHALRWRP